MRLIALLLATSLFAADAPKAKAPAAPKAPGNHDGVRPYPVYA